jgi:hypothetical protein
VANKKRAPSGTVSTVVRIYVPEGLAKELKGKPPAEATKLIGGALKKKRKKAIPQPWVTEAANNLRTLLERKKLAKS